MSTETDKVADAIIGLEDAEPDRWHRQDAAEPPPDQAGAHRRESAPTVSSTRSGRRRRHVPGDAWTDFLPGSKDVEADWVELKCGNYNKVTKACSGQNYE